VVYIFARENTHRVALGLHYIAFDFFHFCLFFFRFAALPTLQKFMNSDKSMKNGPFNGPNAHWGAAKWGAK